MAIDQDSRWCEDCQRNTLHHRHRTSEMWGLALTILTAGLYFPIWILTSIAGATAGYRCQVCGRKN